MTWLFPRAESYTTDDTPQAVGIDEYAGEITNLIHNGAADAWNGVTFNFSGTTQAFEFEVTQTNRSGTEDGFKDRRFILFELLDTNGDLVVEVSTTPGDWPFRVLDTTSGNPGYEEVRNNIIDTGIDVGGTHTVGFEWDGSAWTVDIDSGAWTYTVSNFNNPVHTLTVGSAEYTNQLDDGINEWETTDLVRDRYVPRNPSAAPVTQSKIGLSWDSPAPGTGETPDRYRVYQATASGSTKADYTHVATPSGTSEDDTGLAEGKAYYYRVAAIFDGAESPVSGEATTATLLTAPVSLEATDVTTDSVSLAWVANHGRGETVVEYRPTGSGDPWTTDQTVTRDTEAATIGGLHNGEQYDVRVAATTDDAVAVDEVIQVDVEAGTTETVASGETLSVASPHTVAGTVANSGTVTNQE